MKLNLLRDLLGGVGGTLIMLGVVTKLFEQPVRGDRYAMSRIAWIEAGCGFLVLLPWGFVSRAAELRKERDQTRLRLGHCVHCGYDLRATPGRCPECGHARAPAGT